MKTKIAAVSSLFVVFLSILILIYFPWSQNYKPLLSKVPEDYNVLVAMDTRKLLSGVLEKSDIDFKYRIAIKMLINTSYYSIFYVDKNNNSSLMLKVRSSFIFKKLVKMLDSKIPTGIEYKFYEEDNLICLYKNNPVDYERYLSDKKINVLQKSMNEKEYMFLFLKEFYGNIEPLVKVNIDNNILSGELDFFHENKTILNKIGNKGLSKYRLDEEDEKMVIYSNIEGTEILNFFEKNDIGIRDSIFRAVNGDFVLSMGWNILPKISFATEIRDRLRTRKIMKNSDISKMLDYKIIVGLKNEYILLCKTKDLRYKETGYELDINNKYLEFNFKPKLFLDNISLPIPDEYLFLKKIDNIHIYSKNGKNVVFVVNMEGDNNVLEYIYDKIIK